MRNLDAADEAINDSSLKARLRAMAGKVHVNAFLTASVLTGIAILF